MGTRSTIAIQNEDGSVTGIYVQRDGGFWCNGPILRDHYTDEAKIRELIALGDLSCLNKNVHPDPNATHTFESSQDGVCVAYGRDRGETGVEASTFDDWNTFIENMGQEYDYLFTPGQGWVVRYAERRGNLNEEMTRCEKEREEEQ